MKGLSVKRPGGNMPGSPKGNDKPMGELNSGTSGVPSRATKLVEPCPSFGGYEVKK